jgi:transposase
MLAMGKASKKSGTPDDQQFKLFVELPAGGKLGRTAADSGRRFITGDPLAIVIGTTPLDQYLRESGQTNVFTVARLLDEQDWTEFESSYAATGRPPFSPRQMMGLILYGVMQGVHSLRELERLARLDLGCMWITGGIAPDFTKIGRFITRHQTLLPSSFFESLTRHVIKATGSKTERLAGDGTVIEAACSHYKLLRADAIRTRAEDARAALTAEPDDVGVQREHRISEQCVKALEERTLARERSGRSTETLSVSPTEPEAMVQPLKRKRGFSTSYKPSILANEDRIITAVAIDPSSETKVVAALLDQSERVVCGKPEEVLFDAGYFDDSVITATIERDISLLCPDGQLPGKLKQGNVFPKAQFEFDESTETYRCPAGRTLVFMKAFEATKTKPARRQYGTAACGECAIRADCTTQNRRHILRNANDEKRDALRQVMRQPQVRGVFAQRKAMVEPVFSHLRGKQGLNRFRRKGLAAVAGEFALHALAHNLARAVALLAPDFGLISALLYLFHALQLLRLRIAEIFLRLVPSEYGNVRTIRSARSV